MREFKAKLGAVVLGLAALGMAGVSHAETIGYSIGTGSTVSALSADPGLVIQTAVLPMGGFSLNDGESYSFAFFNIWTNEKDVNVPDDVVPHGITATLDFDAPVDTNLSVTGLTRGKLLITGTLQSGGHVTWDGPVVYPDAGDGLSFRVTLSDADFNLGRFLHVGETTPGERYGATITATVEQISSPDAAGGPTAVPTPAAGFGGMALVAGLGVWRRARRGN